MIRTFAIETLVAAPTFAGSVQISAQDNGSGKKAELFIPDGETVYDVVNHVTRLADANLATTSEFRFGDPLCESLVVELPGPCVNASGSMNYTSAVAWVAAMNAYQDPTIKAVGYLGHKDWQLPTAPSGSSYCSAKGPAPYRESFGFGCQKNWLAYLYNTLGIKAPNTAVPRCQPRSTGCKNSTNGRA